MKGKIIFVKECGVDNMRHILPHSDKTRMDLYLSTLSNKYFAFVAKNKGNIEAQAKKINELNQSWMSYVRLNYSPVQLLYIDKFIKHIDKQVRYAIKWPRKFADIARGRKNTGSKTIVLKTTEPDTRLLNLKEQEDKNLQLVDKLLS